MEAEILAYYEQGREADRLADGQGLLELLRTRDILRRKLPAPPLRVLDVGGATGVHARWLAGRGYRVRLVDPVPGHVAAATAAGLDAVRGDARSLAEPAASMDAVLLLGPLYHLPAPADRRAALAEAVRVVCPGGVVVAAAITRFASLHDGLSRGRLTEPEFARIVTEDLASGEHRNPTAQPDYFTTAYFHRPEELLAEGRAAGLADPRVLAVEGVAGWLGEPVTALLRDAAARESVLGPLRTVEAEPSLLGASPHLLLVGRRPSA